MRPPCLRCCYPAEPCHTPAALQIGNILIMIYLFLIIVEVIVNLKNKPEAVEKVGPGRGTCIAKSCLLQLPLA